MSQIKKICNFMSTNIAVLIIIFSVIAFFYPKGFSWATNYTTLFLGAAMFGMGLTIKTEDFKITLKCTADVGDFYRRMYPDIVVRGYHCPPVQQLYWNTVYLSGFPDDELLNMIDHAYNTVINSFSKKIQKQIAEDD